MALATVRGHLFLFTERRKGLKYKTLAFLFVGDFSLLENRKAIEFMEAVIQG